MPHVYFTVTTQPGHDQCIGSRSSLASLTEISVGKQVEFPQKIVPLGFLQDLITHKPSSKIA